MIGYMGFEHMRGKTYHQVCIYVMGERREDGKVDVGWVNGREMRDQPQNGLVDLGWVKGLRMCD